MDRISHPSAVDIGGGRRGFRGKDTVAGAAGTVVTATHLNAQQEEDMAVIEAAGMEGNPDNLAQILAATRSQAANFRVAGGTANALTFSSVASHKIAAFLAGFPFRFVTSSSANTGAGTFKVDDLPAVPLVRRSGAALVAGDLSADTAFAAIFVAGSVRLLGVVASDINLQVAANKSPFNISIQSLTTRTALSAASGFQSLASGAYVKKSATSNILVRASTNIFSAGGTAAGQMKVSVGGQDYTVITVNMTSGSNASSPNGAKIFSGLPAGATAWALAFGRTDALAWASIVNPNSSDSSNLPPAGTNTQLEFSEFEP